MLDVFLRTLPFFIIIGLGFGAARSGFLPASATPVLTKFVFFFPLSAMLFRFAANLSIDEIFNVELMMAYLVATFATYGLAQLVAYRRKLSLPVAAVEAQCFATGNTGFLGLPMMAILFGEAAIGPMMLIVSIDMVVFSSLIVVLITIGRGQSFSPAGVWRILRSVLTNPMIVSISAGLMWSAWALPMPAPMADFLNIMSGAATPGALFAIGASLAVKSTERMQTAAWLSFGKLVVHPIAMAVCVLYLFPVDAFRAQVAIAAAALPAAGNIFMIAQYYGVAPQRASAAIFLSTAASIVTLPLVIAWVSAL